MLKLTDEFKTTEELGLKVDLNYLDDPYADCYSTNDLWDTFVKDMRQFGFDNYIVFGFAFGPERSIQIKNHDLFPWMSAVNQSHVYCSTAKSEIFEELIKRGIFEDDPLVFHLHNSKKSAILGRDFLSPDMPNYEHAKMLWVDCADLNFHSAFCVPYEGHHPLSRHGFGLHSTLHGAEFEALIQKVGKDVLLSCHRFVQQFYVLFPKDIANDIGLTKKQYQVLKMFVYGFQNDEIAHKMDVTSAAISAHLREIKRKLEAVTNREIPAKAKKLWLVD